MREFLHVDDMASAAKFCLENDIPHSMVNVGSGDEVSIADLTRLICKVVGFQGELDFDTTKPDGTPRKRVDVSRLTALGWTAGVPLEQGLAETYRWYLNATDARLAV